MPEPVEPEGILEQAVLDPRRHAGLQSRERILTKKCGLSTRVSGEGIG